MLGSETLSIVGVGMIIGGAVFAIGGAGLILGGELLNDPMPSMGFGFGLESNLSVASLRSCRK